MRSQTGVCMTLKIAYSVCFLAISTEADSMGTKGSKGPVVVAGSPRRRVSERDDAEALPGATGESKMVREQLVTHGCSSCS